MSASLFPFGHQGSSTGAKAIGNCPNCGGTRYENLVHHCSTGAIIQHHAQAAPKHQEDSWTYYEEPFRPLYIGLLQKYRSLVEAEL